MKYEPAQMTRAIDYVSEGQPMRRAAKVFGVPYSTLARHCIGSGDNAGKFGPTTLLSSSHEDKLVEWVISSAKKGFPLKRESLMSSVADLFSMEPENNPFKNGRPGRKWLDLFLKTHPEISQRIPESINKARAMVTPERIRNWFQYVRNYLEEELEFLTPMNLDSRAVQRLERFLDQGGFETFMRSNLEMKRNPLPSCVHFLQMDLLSHP